MDVSRCVEVYVTLDVCLCCQREKVEETKSEVVDIRAIAKNAREHDPGRPYCDHTLIATPTSFQSMRHVS